MRINKELRENIERQIFKSIPVIDYERLLLPLVQKVVYDHMPSAVKAAYDDPETRRYLKRGRVYARAAGGYRLSTTMYARDETGNRIDSVIGLSYADQDIDVVMDESSAIRYKEGTLMGDLYRAIKASGYYEAYTAQNELLEDTRKRVKANLASVTTLKRLYDVLEPELHHLIPKEPEKIKVAGLPTCVAPVVADLRKLGAELPDVPKARAN